MEKIKKRSEEPGKGYMKAAQKIATVERKSGGVGNDQRGECISSFNGCRGFSALQVKIRMRDEKSNLRKTSP